MAPVTVEDARAGRRALLLDSCGLDRILRHGDALGEGLIDVLRRGEVEAYLSYATLLERMHGCRTHKEARRREDSLSVLKVKLRVVEREGKLNSQDFRNLLEKTYCLFISKREFFTQKLRQKRQDDFTEHRGWPGLADTYNAALAQIENFVIVTTEPDFAYLGVDWLDGWMPKERLP